MAFSFAIPAPAAEIPNENTAPTIAAAVASAVPTAFPTNHLSKFLVP